MEEAMLEALRELQKQPFGHTLAQVRTEKELSQGELARAAGVSRPYLTQIENGKRRPSAELAAKLGEALGLPPGSVPLMTGELTVDDLLKMEQTAEAMKLIKSRLSDDEWAEFETLFGDAEAMFGLMQRAAYTAQEPQLPIVEPIPGWESLSKSNRKLVRELVRQLSEAQSILEAESNAD